MELEGGRHGHGGPPLLFLHLSLSHIEISVSAGGFLSISSPSLPPSLCNEIISTSIFLWRPSGRVPMTSFATNSWDGNERRGLGRGRRRLGIFGRGRLFCGLTQRGARQVSAREGVSDGPLLPATLYQLHAPFSCFGRWSDESERRPSASTQLLGNFFKWSILKAWSLGRKHGSSSTRDSSVRRIAGPFLSGRPCLPSPHTTSELPNGVVVAAAAADLGYGMPHARTHT